MNQTPDTALATEVPSDPHTVADWLAAMPLTAAFDAVDLLGDLADYGRAWRDEKVRELYAEGLTDREIAERVGRSHTTITRIRQRLDLPANDRRGGARRLVRDVPKLRTPREAVEWAATASDDELTAAINEGHRLAQASLRKYYRAMSEAYAAAAREVVE